MISRNARAIVAAVLGIACIAGVAAQEKPVLSVLDLRINDVSRDEMLGVVDGLTAALFQSGSFVVIDRTARDALLGEIEFSMTAASDQEAQKKMGKQLSADMVVSGSLSRYHDGKYVLSLRLLETSSAKVVGVSEDFFPDFGAMLSSLDKQARELSSNARPARPASIAAARGSPSPRSPAPGAESDGDEFLPSAPLASTPFQFSIWAPMQLFPADTAVRGLRLTLFASSNAALAGVDIGLVNSVSGVMTGVQVGLLGFAGEARVLQLNAILNVARTVRGAQVGVVNIADRCAGFQLGLVNVSGLLKGAQLGLVNVVRYGGAAGFMPILKLAF
ncbi:MAG: penicillin-binding protein activator LpoB [Spirochaetes bacterium]|nr:penicillin-binding protein activator LpoB [Spirochaetota bacterium]MBU1080089.1 penicillin-binding protein activator LpoB [Spirochaetota bacterium]